MEGLDEYERGLCECGFHSSLTHDKTNEFKVDFKKCPVCAGAQRVDRMQAEKDEQARGKEPPARRDDPSDGRRMYIQLVGKVKPKADADSTK